MLGKRTNEQLAQEYGRYAKLFVRFGFYNIWFDLKWMSFQIQLFQLAIYIENRSKEKPNDGDDGERIDRRKKVER